MLLCAVLSLGYVSHQGQLMFLFYHIMQLLLVKHSLLFHTGLSLLSFQDGQSAGPPPLIPGLGQQGAQGRIPPLNPGPGPGPNKGECLLG